jgi:hypothetical protein
MDKIRFGCKLVSLLIVLSFFVYGFRITYIDIQVIYQWWHVSVWWVIYIIITLSSFWALNLSAAYGLFYTKKWGFIVAYFAIIFSTFFIGYSYVPFIGKIINNIFSIGSRYITLIALNLIVVCYVGYLHALYRRINR